MFTDLMLMINFFFELYGYHRDLHVLTHSFPTRRSSDLQADGPEQARQAELAHQHGRQNQRYGEGYTYGAPHHGHGSGAHFGPGRVGHPGGNGGRHRTQPLDDATGDDPVHILSQSANNPAGYEQHHAEDDDGKAPVAVRDRKSTRLKS